MSDKRVGGIDMLLSNKLIKNVMVSKSTSDQIDYLAGEFHCFLEALYRKYGNDGITQGKIKIKMRHFPVGRKEKISDWT